MKKIVTSLALLSFLAFPVQNAFAWTYDGLNSLNPFTGFRNCNKCEKIKKQRCHVKRQKCNTCIKVKPIKRCARAFDNDIYYNMEY